MKILITGAYGLVGSVVYQHLLKVKPEVEIFGLGRRRQISDRIDPGNTFDIPEDHLFISDLSNLDEVYEILKGFDTVVHMAADPRPDAPWESILKSNILGTYNILEGSVRAGVKRVIAASTVMVSWGYFEKDPHKSIRLGTANSQTVEKYRILPTDPVQPTCLYASSKVYVEAMAKTYTSTHPISIFCLRIGAVNSEDQPSPGCLDCWCSHRDISQIVEKCIEAKPSAKFGIHYAVSESLWRSFDIESARHELGYVPMDRVPG